MFQNICSMYYWLSMCIVKGLGNIPKNGSKPSFLAKKMSNHPGSSSHPFKMYLNPTSRPLVLTKTLYG